jgi:hypothetical protein
LAGEAPVGGGEISVRWIWKVEKVGGEESVVCEGYKVVRPCLTGGNFLAFCWFTRFYILPLELLLQELTLLPLNNLYTSD